MAMVITTMILVIVSLFVNALAVEANGNFTANPTATPLPPPRPPPPKPKPTPAPFPPPDGSEAPVIEVAVREAKVYSFSSATYSRFGHALSSYGSVVAVGSARESTTATVGVFELSIVSTAVTEVSNGAAASVLNVEVAPLASNVTWAQTQAVVAENSEPYYDGFGASLAMGPFALAVGAPYSTSAVTGVSSGAVYAFSMADSQATGDYSVLTAPSNAASFNMQFGSTVALQGTALAVGAPGASAQGRMSGSVYLYQYSTNNSSWVEEAVLQDDEGGAQFARFGGAVCLSEDGGFLAVGASGYSKHVIHGGAVFLYYRAAVADGGGGARRAAQESANDTASSSGESESVEQEDDEDDDGDQQVDSSAWALHSLLVPSSLQAYAYFGKALAFRGTVGLVSAYDNDGSGVVYLFQRQQSEHQGTRRSLRDRAARQASSVAVSWVLLEVLRPTVSSAMNEFGASLAVFHTSDVSDAYTADGIQLQLVDAYVAAVGSPGDTTDAASAQRTGAVYLFLSPYDAPEGWEHAGSSAWALMAKAFANDSTAYNQYGQSLALMGAHLLVGAELADTNVAQRTGAVYVETNLIPYLVAAAQEGGGQRDDDRDGAGDGDGSGAEDGSPWRRNFWAFFSSTGGVVTMSFVPIAVIVAFFVAHKKRKGDKIFSTVLPCSAGSGGPQLPPGKDEAPDAEPATSPTVPGAGAVAAHKQDASAQNPLVIQTAVSPEKRSASVTAGEGPGASVLARMWYAMSAAGGSGSGQHTLLPQCDAAEGRPGVAAADLRVEQSSGGALSIRSPITHVPAHSSLLRSPSGGDFSAAPLASFRVAAGGEDKENAQPPRGGRHRPNRSLEVAQVGKSVAAPTGKGDETIRV